VALSAGIEYATGAAVITMDSDGQHPIDKIADFVIEREL
jgi:glycosyltransferase involved in cell wall biosynthesis